VGNVLGNEISPSLPQSGTGDAKMSKYENNNRIADLKGSFVTFYENDKFIGSIDYSDKSEYYIRDACENWISGIMACSTVVYHSELSQQLDFDFDAYGGGVEHFGKLDTDDREEVLFERRPARDTGERSD
jgi:hypothetical protein